MSATNGTGTGNATLTLTIASASQTFSLVNSSESSGCGSETTCSVTLKGSVTDGADNLNTTSGSAPTWTSGSASDAVVAAMAFGVNVTPCVNYTLVNFSAGTAGANPAPADLLASTFGAYGTIIGSGSKDEFFWKFDDAPDVALTYQTGANFPLAGTMPLFCQGGATYANSGTVGLEYNNGTAGGTEEQSLQFNLPTYFQSYDVTHGMYFRTTIPPTDTGVGLISTPSISRNRAGTTRTSALKRNVRKTSFA